MILYAGNECFAPIVERKATRIGAAVIREIAQLVQDIGFYRYIRRCAQIN